MSKLSAKASLNITQTAARRLAIIKQQLAGPYQGEPPSDNVESILRIVQALGCLQLDPISAVTRSHLLVLFSRLGSFNPDHVDTLLFKDRQLFEYWAHVASIVLTEDYPIHRELMSKYRDGRGDSSVAVGFMNTNAELRQHILDEITEKGPRLSRQFENKATSGWESSGWTSGREVSRMLDFLWIKGEIMVAGRQGGQKVWDLAERVLPEWTPREILSTEEIVRRAAQKSLRALGVATPQQMNKHFTRGRYPNLKQVVAELEKEGAIQRVTIAEDGNTGAFWKGDWYIHRDDLPLLERLQTGEWEPRTTLLSPFDNLICDRDRTELMWNFYFRIEIYVPKHLRQYGYYVLPILHGDRLIGRIDPTMDRKNKRLLVNAVYAELDAPTDKQTGKAVAASIESLAAFLGAKSIEYGDKLPDQWKSALG